MKNSNTRATEGTQIFPDIDVDRFIAPENYNILRNHKSYLQNRDYKFYLGREPIDGARVQIYLFKYLINECCV